ncbi:putative membrane protein [Streptomyces sp. Ag109_G2-6]|uniref:DUF4142 domain-containing protein n=1 Tax=Streptomyces TaxID=1883 RepID=UPI000CCB5D25|nr:MULTISPECIES: DUF4142 domain-containing protein [Streptomyces]RPF44160.1 putative membrane protein [Streptomyces sp. Ag109_G2-6]
MRPSRSVIAAAVAAVAMGTFTPAALAAGQAGNDDQNFVVTVHQGNLAEIAAGTDTRMNAQDTCVKDVGRTLVKDHTKLDTDLRALAQKLDISLPDKPTEAQQAQLKQIQGKAGTPGYDTAWLKAQADAHQATLKTIDDEIARGDNAQVVAAAKDARPVVAMHLDMVRGGTCHVMG